MNELLAPEFEFLCRLVRPQPDDERALELVRQGLDFERVLQLAAAHGVRPRLLNALSKDVWREATRKLNDELNGLQRRHVARSLYATSELLRIAAAFDKAGISFATFKGAALSMQLRNDVSWREFNDVDIIIHAADLSAAECVLETCGYCAALGDSSEWRAAFLGYQRQYMFTKAGSPLAVDLHWEFIEEGAYFSLQASDIWDRLIHVTIADRAIPTFGGETLAVYLAAHGFKEGWRSLGWVCDFGELYQRSDFDWVSLCQASAGRKRRRILLGLLLAERLLGVSVNDVLTREANRDGEILARVEKIERRMSCITDSAAPSAESLQSMFETCETWTDRLRRVWNLACTRTTSDYYGMPLPRPFWRLYHLTRPFRLAVKFFSLT